MGKISRKMKFVIFQYNFSHSIQFFALIPSMYLILCFNHVIVNKMSEYMSNLKDFNDTNRSGLVERFCSSISNPLVFALL